MDRKIKNIFGEKLDVTIEGSRKTNRVTIFVHGFGTNKDEGFNFFKELSKYLKEDTLSIRFDLSGYGKSEGIDHEFQLQKAAGDLDTILRFAKKTYPECQLAIVSHSLGCFVTALRSPFGVKRTVFTGIPNSKPDSLLKTIQERIKSKNGQINENDISIYPRTDGSIQSIGKDFWSTVSNFQPTEFLQEYGAKTRLLVLKPLQDEIVPNKYFKEYSKIKNIEYEEMDGDHNFSKKEDRTKVFKRIQKFLLE